MGKAYIKLQAHLKQNMWYEDGQDDKSLKVPLGGAGHIGDYIFNGP